jgi:Cu2+-containing amine oxidase
MVDHEDENTGEVIPGEWRREVTELLSSKTRTVNNYTEAAKLIRDQYADYFWEEGAIPAQWKATGILPGSTDSEMEDDEEFVDGDGL